MGAYGVAALCLLFLHALLRRAPGATLFSERRQWLSPRLLATAGLGDPGYSSPPALTPPEGPVPNPSAFVLVDARNMRIRSLTPTDAADRPLPSEAARRPDAAEVRVSVTDLFHSLDPRVALHFVFDGRSPRKAPPAFALPSGAQVTYAGLQQSADDLIVDRLKAVPLPKGTVLRNVDAADALRAIAELAPGPPRWLLLRLKRCLRPTGGEAAAPPAPLPALLGPRAKLTVLGLTDAPAAYAPLLKALDAFQREHHWPFATCTISAAQALVLTDDARLAVRCERHGALPCGRFALRSWAAYRAATTTAAADPEGP